MSSCLWALSMGRLLIVNLTVLLYYILFIFLLRAKLGEKVWQHASFWFFFTNAILILLAYPIFFEIDYLCQAVCYTIMPAHGAVRVTTVGFIFSKLSLLHPERILQTSSRQRYSGFEMFCYLSVSIYCVWICARSLVRIWGGPCHPVGEPSSCIGETDPIVFLKNVPDFVSVLCEFVLFWVLVRDASDFYANQADIADNNWVQTEVLNRIWWYGTTSICTLVTNFFLYSTLAAASLLQKQESMDEFFAGSYCAWIFYLNLGIINMTINIIMVFICFPARSFNAYCLLQAICENKGFSSNNLTHTEFTAEDLRTFYELENIKRDAMTREIEVRANTLANMGHRVTVALAAIPKTGGRKISRNWEKDPYTGEKTYLPDCPYSSTSDTCPGSTTGSSSFVLLQITDVPLASNNEERKSSSITRTSRDEQSRISQTPTLDMGEGNMWNDEGSAYSTVAESVLDFKVVE